MARFILLMWIMVLIMGFSGCANNKDLQLHIVVKGHVLDSSGEPISNARVQASLGLDLDGDPVFTKDDGSYIVEARSAFWYKGHPNIRASSKGYSEEWLYFDRWDQGQRRFERTITLNNLPTPQ